MQLSSKRVLAVAVLVLASCRDLSVPPPPGPVGPGTLSGRAVVSLPGSPLRQALSGASVEVLGNGLSTTTDADGYFQLNGITSTAGQVLFRADVDHDGVPDRQRLLTLDALQVGPGKQVSLGDVVLSENALVRGKVLRGDIADSPTGHAGTLIFVPIGPFTATSGDDGSFVLPELPEGTLSIAFFRQGYAARGLDAVSLSSGQALTLEPIRLALQPGVVNPAPVSGRVLVASGEPAVGAMVALTDGAATLTTNTDADGHYTFPLVAGGRYSLTAHLGGSGDARFLNLLVTGTPLALPDLVLGALALGTGGGGGSTGGGGGTTGGGGGSDGGGGIVEDSGVDAGIDAGVDAGVDAGIDAGVDAGVDAGPVLALPLAPTQLTATLNSTTIDVSWVGVPSVPPTLGYELRVIPQGGGAQQVFQVGASPYPVQLAGLTLGTTYTFAVSASNVLGPGPEALSAPVDYVVLPGAPTGVTAVPGAGVATVSWTPPVSTGGRPLTAYLVTASPGGQVITVTAPSTQTTVQNLNNGTQYSFSVVARTTVGDSTPSTSNLVIPQVGNTLTITGGTGQSALPNQFFPQPITFALKTPQNVAVTNTPVTLSVDNGAVVSPASLSTSGAGLGSVAVRAGRKSGVVTLSMFVGGLLMQTVSLSVTVPPPLTVIPIVNADAQSSVSGQLNGPAAQTTLNPGGFAAAPDGTLYVFNRNECTVLKISSDGLSSVVAGTGACMLTTPQVNNLPLATGLTLALRLVFDAPRNTLYVRSSNHLIAIPFDGSTTRLLIGGGLGLPTYGDGLLGTSASISSDGDLVQSPDGRYLYFMDPFAKRVRRYDLQTNVVTGQLTAVSPCSALQPTSSMLPPLAIDSKGRLFMISPVCGLNSYFLTRWTPGSGTTIQILSGVVPGFSNGGRAADVLVDSSSRTALVVDAADNIYLNDGASRFYKIDVTTGLLSLVMGSTANSVSGNYGQATSATFDLPNDASPAPPVFDAAGNLYFVGSTSVRSITQLGASVRTPFAISISAGNGQSGPLTSLLGPMQVSVTVNGNPLSNATVWWESLTAGSGVLSPGTSQTLAGTATMQARVGQKLGAQTFRAGLRDFYGEDAGTIDFTTTSTLPTAGFVTSLVNADRALAVVKPGPAVLTPMQNLHGLAVGDGGVLYLGHPGTTLDLLRVDPSGDMRVVRSLPMPTANPATEYAIAVDESRNRLYFAWFAAQIHVLDLTSGLQQLWVGSGAQGTAGDGSLGTAAALGLDLRMEVDPDGNLFTTDNNNRIRFVTPAGVIDSWVAQPTAVAFTGLNCTQAFAWAMQSEAASNGTGASARNHFIQFDAQKNAYVPAFYCGTSLGLSAYVNGILQITPGGVITEYARFPAGTRGAGLTRDNDGTIYWADVYSNPTISLWRIDPTAPPRTSVKVVGSGARATGPDFVTGLSTTISPGYVVMLPTHRPAWVDNSRSIRTWW